MAGSGNPLKRLIHEIHRRSLWKVLGIYVVGGWIGFEVVQGLTEALGLPSWFPALAVVLLIIRLAVVLATAFVQEGGPCGSGNRNSPSRSSGAIWREYTLAGSLDSTRISGTVP